MSWRYYFVCCIFFVSVAKDITTEGFPLTADSCDDLLDGKLGTPNPVDVNECQAMRRRRVNCEFDTTQCGNCLMGYQIDEKTSCPRSCQCATHGVVEGDIFFEEIDVPIFFDTYDSPQRDENKQEAADNRVKLWNYKTSDGRIAVPYIINITSERGINAINEAILRFSETTCIQFQPRNDEDNFVVFNSDDGCWSRVGVRGGGQEISIGKNCEFSGVVQHEMLHALGFWHEQSRPDRDQYVSIEYHNIQEDKLHNFNTRRTIDSLGSIYDKMSIMHYGGYAFSKNGLPSIIDIRTNQPVRSQRDGLTERDVNQLNLLYECSDSKQWSEWGAWSSCDVTCGDGSQIRRRHCHLPPKNEAGNDENSGNQKQQCTGLKEERRSCSMNDCKVIGLWSQWAQWQQCTQTCGSGYQIRGRTCENGITGEMNCFGPAWEGQPCNTEACNQEHHIFGLKKYKTTKPFCQYGIGYVGDFNGDKRADIACVYYGGWMQIASGTKGLLYDSISWEGSTSFANPPSQCEGYVGDFNCDGCDDLLCHQKSKQLFSIHLSFEGTFSKKVDYTFSVSNFCSDVGDVLTIADVNGDSCHDFICKSPSGKITTLKNIFNSH